MLDKFIESLSDEQKQQLLEELQADLTEKESKPVLMADDFTFSIKPNNPKTKIPVTENKRFNKFVDDGTEAQGEEFETPKTELTERRRPPVKKVKQKCSKCGRMIETHPTHARDWFTCDRCIGGR